MVEKQRKMTIKIENRPRENIDRSVCIKLEKMQGGGKGQEDKKVGKVSSSVPNIQNNY